MGFNSDEVERAGMAGWLSCLEDRLNAGESDSILLLPVGDCDEYWCGFYEQSMEAAADIMGAAHISPYGYQLLSPHRADRLVYASANKQQVPASVVLVERPWDVVLLAQEGLELAAFVSPLDLAEYHDRLNRFLLEVQRVVWPIHSSELSVEFMRNLFRLSPHALERLAFLLFPEGVRFSEWLCREGSVVGQARLDSSLSATELLRF